MGKIINLEAFRKEKKQTEKNQLTGEKLAIYEKFLALIQKMEASGLKKEECLKEIAKAILRKLPPETATEIIEHYQEKYLKRKN